MCVRSRGKDIKLAKEQVRTDQTEQEGSTEEKELVHGRVAKETTKERREARKAPMAASVTGTVTKGLETKAKANVKARAKLDIATVAGSKGTSE